MLRGRPPRIRRGRPTEIDYLNGEVVQLGAQTGVPTPLNALAVALTHRVEASGEFLAVADIRQEVGRASAALASGAH